MSTLVLPRYAVLHLTGLEALLIFIPVPGGVDFCIWLHIVPGRNAALFEKNYYGRKKQVVVKL
jgi:hypothetical protein